MPHREAGAPPPRPAPPRPAPPRQDSERTRAAPRGPGGPVLRSERRTPRCAAPHSEPRTAMLVQSGPGMRPNRRGRWGSGAGAAGPWRAAGPVSGAVRRSDGRLLGRPVPSCVLCQPTPPSPPASAPRGTRFPPLPLADRRNPFTQSPLCPPTRGLLTAALGGAVAWPLDSGRPLDRGVAACSERSLGPTGVARGVTQHHSVSLSPDRASVGQCACSAWLGPGLPCTVLLLCMCVSLHKIAHKIVRNNALMILSSYDAQFCALSMHAYSPLSTNNLFILMNLCMT